VYRIDPGLLHRDALGQIARLVDIRAAPDGDMIGQQLQRVSDSDILATAQASRFPA
jgi:hypothetical protein